MFSSWTLLNVAGEILFSIYVKYTSDLNEPSLNTFYGYWTKYRGSFIFLKQLFNIMKLSFASLNFFKLMWSPSISFLSDSYPPLINLYKENAFSLDNFYLLKPSFYVISLLRSLLKGYLFVFGSVFEILFVLDKLFIVSLNNVLLRVDILVGL